MANYWDRWKNSHWTSLSGVSGFRQDGYPKKTKDDVRSDWRARKGFSRDQSKGRTWCKCGSYLKGVDHRARRAYEREMIFQGRYWELEREHPEQFVSSWDAC